MEGFLSFLSIAAAGNEPISLNEAAAMVEWAVQTKHTLSDLKARGMQYSNLSRCSVSCKGIQMGLNPPEGS